MIVCGARGSKKIDKLVKKKTTINRLIAAAEYNQARPRRGRATLVKISRSRRGKITYRYVICGFRVLRFYGLMITKHTTYTNYWGVCSKYDLLFRLKSPKLAQTNCSAMFRIHS